MGDCELNLETNDKPCMIEKYIIQGYLAFMSKQWVLPMKKENENILITFRIYDSKRSWVRQKF